MCEYDPLAIIFVIIVGIGACYAVGMIIKIIVEWIVEWIAFKRS